MSELHAIRALPHARVEHLPGPYSNPVRFSESRNAACNRSTRLAGARGGGWAASPRCVRMRWITAGSSIAAMSFSCPPQRGHCSMSISNTRFNRRAQSLPSRRQGSCVTAHSRQACARNRFRAPVWSQSAAAPVPPPGAASRFVPAPHESGYDADAASALTRPGVDGARIYVLAAAESAFIQVKDSSKPAPVSRAW